ncbi:MAG TPA: isochorismatase family protein [Roseiarcus sp.]|nr:isochorismatase family protein [Roseiarcus sp.]
MRRFLLLAACLATLGGARAETIIDDWAKVRVPPPPQLKPVTVDPKSDALLLLDFNGAEAATSGPCNKAMRPRCLASLPKLKTALAAARAHGVFVVYSETPTGKPGDIRPDVAPKPGEPIVRSGPDKFIGTELRALLAGKGIKRVIVTGTAAEGAVLNTAADAALHGLNIVLPVDGMSSSELYAEQYVAWHMTHAPGVATKTTLTTLDRLRY